jgi:hypothetical protein
MTCHFDGVSLRQIGTVKQPAVTWVCRTPREWGIGGRSLTSLPAMALLSGSGTMGVSQATPTRSRRTSHFEASAICAPGHASMNDLVQL